MIHNISRFIAALALLATAQGAWAQKISGNWADEGNRATTVPQSEDGSTLYISTAEQLACYAYGVNNDGKTTGSASGYYCGRTVELLADIDLSAHYWTPIGTNSSYYFNGFFHGNGHVISGMNIKLSSTDNGITCIGLFGHIIGRNSGTGTTSITNLTLKDFSVSNTTNPTDHIYVGGLVGHCNKNGTTTSITNCCLINGTVYSDGAQRLSLGGLVAGGTPTTCANNYRYNVSTTARNDETVHYPISGESVANCATLTVGTHGSVAIGGSVGVITDGKIYAASGQTVTLSDTPDAGYMVGYTASGVTVTSGAFTMPANDDATVAASFTIDPAHFSQSGTEYTIHTATGWGVFCDALQDNATYNRFSGKTVKLGADITVSRMAGSDNHEFTGTFDGGGHTLTFSHTATDNYCAPFRTVQGATAETPAVISNLNVVSTVTADDYRHPAGLIALQSGYVSVTDCNVEAHINCTKGTVNTSDLYPAALVSQAGSGGTLTVSGCTATGTISTDGKYAAGLVGIVQGTATITDCLSSVTINSSTAGDGTHGGIVAVVTGSGTITGCVFNGKLLSKNTGNDATGNCAGFVAWGNGTISNCLYAPAAIEGDEAEVVAGTGDYPSGTFYRGTAPTVTNCYYTRALGTAQGKAPLAVTAGDNVTISGISPVGSPVENGTYSVSGITAYAKGITRTVSDVTTFYYGAGDDVSLTLSNTATAPTGYQYSGYTASGGTLSGTTLTMPDEDVTVSVNTAALRSTGVAVPVSYVDADGNTQTAQAIALDGTETDTDLGILGEETWYFVGADIAFDQMLNLSGDVNLILADGSTMNVTSNFNGIKVDVSLTIYGQTDGTGTLNATGDNEGIHSDSGNLTISGGRVTATGDNNEGIHSYSGTITISGGRVSATGGNNGIYTNGGNITISGGWVTATSDNSTGIYTKGGNITISGGRVSATGGVGINTNSGTITLGCTTASDFIYVSIYVVGRDGRLNIADGQTLYDEGGNPYSGNGVNIPAGKTLRPYDCRLDLSDDADNTDAIAAANGKVYNVTLQGRTLYKDGAWNTLCLPFDISTASGTLSGDNVQAMTLNTTTSNFADGTLTLNFDAATGQTIPAGTPFIIKWDNTGVNIENPVFVGVTVSNATNDATVTDVLTFTGTYAPVAIPADGDNTKLYLGAANKLYYPNAAMTIGTHRAYFQLLGDLTAGGNEHGDDVEDGVRAFVLNFGDDEATGIITTNFTNSTNSSNEWYTLDGRKLDGQPTAKGLYIHGGKKVAIK